MAHSLLPADAAIAVHDVVGGNVSHLPALIDLLVEGFPDSVTTLPRVRSKAERGPDADSRFIHHQWLITVSGEPAGATSFSYVPGRNIGLGIYLVIRPPYRQLAVAGHNRLASWLHLAVAQQLISDAELIGRPLPWGLAVEVSVPALAIQYRQYGFRELPVTYAEPQFPEGWRPSGNLDDLPPITWQTAQLGLFPCVGHAIDVHTPQLLTDAVAAFLIDHYGLPAEQPDVQRMLADAANYHALEGVGL